MVSLAATHAAMRPPPTPTKLPSIGLKRNRSCLDASNANEISAPTKRPKVQFSPDVDVRYMENWGDKSYALVREEVSLGIASHLAPREQRDDMHYVKLLSILGEDAFSSDAPPPHLLAKYVQAIDSRVSSFGDCAQLVTAVLDLCWLGRSDSFVALYTRFLCALISAHPKFTVAVTERLVSKFAKLPASLGRLPEESPVSRTKMFSRLHITLHTLIRKHPSTSASLVRTLRQELPNDLATTRSFLQYQKHLIRLAGDTPELKSEILSMIVQRLVSMDVQIQEDIEDLEDDAEDQLLQPVADQDPGLDDCSDDSDDESLSESELTVTEEEQRLRDLRLKVGKMDGTLDLLFQYYTPLVQDGAPPERNDAWHQLISHFNTFILPNRCRHAQFLLFHFSQVSAQHISLFAQRCIQSAFQESSSARHRLVACAYVASFTARGSHIPRESVRDVFEILCHYLEGMRQKYDPTCRGPDRRSYSLYYAVAQAVLYIFCFRWRDLVVGCSPLDTEDDTFDEDVALAEGRDLVWLSGTKEVMHKNIYSRLNPLKVCSQAIVSEFAKIANHLRFVYVFPLLETNKRLRLGPTISYYGVGGVVDIGRRETAWDQKKGETHHQLEAYFPFDPYHLPKSKRWVKEDYNEWKLPAGMRRDDDIESEEDEESDESSDESVPGDSQEVSLAGAVGA